MAVVHDQRINDLVFEHNDKAIMTFHADGRITVDESLKPDEAAKKVLQCLKDQFMHMRNPKGDA
jgi:ArsR family metal-binding transcriptional regulator